MNKTLSLIALGSFLMGLPVSYSAGLKAPFDFANAKVLPQGVRNVRLKSLLTGANDRYGNTGRLEPVGQAMNSSVSFQKLVDGKPSTNNRNNRTGARERAELKAFLQTSGVNDLNAEAGKTTGDLHVEAGVVTPIVAYGVSRKLTVAVAAPYYQFSSKVKTGFVAGNTLSDLGDKLIAQGMTNEYNELVTNLENPITKKLVDYQYLPLQNEEISGFGDIKVVSKYLLTQKEGYALALQADLTAPTGKKPNVHKLVDLNTGDGQWDVGMGTIADYRINEKFNLSGTLGVVAELPDTLPRRIPEYSDSAVTPDIDPNTRRDLGDQAYSQLVARYDLLEGLTFSTAYGFQYKEKDRYSGESFNRERYDWLEQNTEQHMHTGQLGLAYSTLPLFLKKQFMVPLEAGLNYTHVLGGKNVNKDAVVAFDLAMYF